MRCYLLSHVNLQNVTTVVAGPSKMIKIHFSYSHFTWYGKAYFSHLSWYRDALRFGDYKEVGCNFQDLETIHEICIQHYNHIHGPSAKIT